MSLLACKKSVLGDISIEDPSLIKVKVKIHEKTSKKRQLQVTLRDKSSRPLELSNGKVVVNNVETSFYSKNVISISRGYNYRVPDNVDNFLITIFWNENDSYSFVIDEVAGFPGFDPSYWYTLSKSQKKFNIGQAPFRGAKIEVEYKILK